MKPLTELKEMLAALGVNLYEPDSFKEVMISDDLKKLSPNQIDFLRNQLRQLIKEEAQYK